MTPDIPRFILPLLLGISLAVPLTIWVGIRKASRALALPPRTEASVASGAAAVFGVWLVVTVGLGALGMFRPNPDQVVPLIAIGILLPIVVGYGILALFPTVHRLLEATPQHSLILLQIYRAAGAIFLLLLAQGKLPGSFAIPAGSGDLLVGLTAPLVASGYGASPARWRGVVLLWNGFGLADLFLAVATGFLSSPGPLQLFALEAPNRLISSFPLVLIPTVLVPVSVLLHLASLKGLMSRAPTLATA